MHVLKWGGRLGCDQHGSILVQYTVYVVVFFGLVGLLTAHGGTMQ